MSKQGWIRNTIYWVCVFAASSISILIMLILFAYPDVKSITAWSFDVLDCAFRGDLRNYYSWVMENRFGSNHMVIRGNYLPMIPTALWNLPAYVYYRLSGTSGMLTAKYIIWQKTLYVVLLVLLAIVLFRILSNCVKEDNDRQIKQEILLLVMSSPAVVFSCFYFGQDEILYILTVVLALFAFLSEKRILFWAMSIISVTICPITLLPILFLILTREKRIYVVLIQMVVLCSPAVLFDIFYRDDMIYQEYKTGIIDWVAGIFSSSSIGLQFGNVSLVGIAFTIMFFGVYFKKPVDYTKEEIIYEMALLMCLLGFGTVQIWYRFLIATPFLIMLVMIQKENRNLNLFLLFLVAVCRGLQIISDNMVLNPQYLMQNGLSMKIANMLTGGGFMWKESLHNALNYGERSFDSIYPLLGCVCYGVLGILFWINRPRAKKVYQFEIPEKVSLAGMALINFAILLAFFLIGGPGWKWVISV